MKQIVYQTGQKAPNLTENVPNLIVNWWAESDLWSIISGLSTPF